MRIVGLFGFLFSSFCHSQTWTQLQNFPGSGRDDAAVFMINQKAYCVGGRSVSNCERDMYAFDCINESWNAGASMPAGTERQYAAAFSYNGKGYVLCGVDCNNVLKKDFYEYNPVTDSWQSLPDFPGVARHGAHCVVNGNRVFLIGGYDGIFLNDVWEYDLVTAVWSQKNNLPFSGFWRGAAFVINGNIHIAYGFTNGNNYNHHVYVYDEANDSWSAVTNLILPARKYISCAVINNKVFCYGGQDSSNTILNDLLVIDLSAASVSTLSGISSGGRKGGSAFSINNHFYTTTGFTSGNLRVNETWKHDGIVGVKENGKESGSGMVVYPSPAADKINIESEEMLNKIVLIDYKGVVVFSSGYLQNEIEIDISELTPGIYSMRLISNKSSITRKVVVAR